MGPKRDQPSEPITAIKPATTNPVGIFLPPVNARILEITGLTARKSSITSKRDNRMGESSENVASFISD
ncbi:MAG: hypothetical protein HQK65_20985 [Desulfamplus sp.]|nr:hypothetical protein [Desulfamplus sp.]